MRRLKRANILIAASVAIVIAGLAAVILQTANASVILSRDTKENIEELYNMETVNALLLDTVIEDIKKAETVVDCAGKVPVADEISEALASLQAQFAGGEVLDVPATLDFVAMDLGLSDPTQKRLAKSIGNNTQERLTAYISDTLQVVGDEQGTTYEFVTEFEVSDFDLTVELETRKALVKKTWHVDNVYLVMDNESKIAVLNFDRTRFTPNDAEYR